MIKKYNQYLKENLDYSDIDPYGEEIWDGEEELNPILIIARKQYKPYDQIIYLDCTGKKLDNLNGIENLINLERLFCPFNNLTSLEGIENLIHLRFLYCHENNLTSLDGIENLINLKRLWCFGNNFSNEYKKYLRNYCKKKKIELDLW